MLGFLHLSTAQCAARSQHPDEARTHLAEAEQIAARIGERSSMRMHFGPTKVARWQLAVGIELGEGGRAYESATRTPLDVTTLHSQERSAALHFRPGPGPGPRRSPPRRRGDPTPGHHRPPGPHPHPQRSPRPKPHPHPRPPSPPPNMGTDQPAPPTQHARPELTIRPLPGIDALPSLPIMAEGVATEMATPPK